MGRAVWKSGSCDWLTSWANNLTSELQPQGRLQLFSPSPFPPPTPFYLSAMASRRLALNLNQALRSRAALKSIQPVKRGFASPVALPSTTQSTTLSNGFTVRSASYSINGTESSLISLLDCHRLLAMGSDFHRRRVDRCRFPVRD